MKATYTTRNGQLQFEVEGETSKEIFEQLADIQEVFDAEARCESCNSSEIFFCVRHVDDNAYYELRCKGCSARFDFGQNKKGGGLFPKRKDVEGAEKGVRGWYKYVPTQQSSAGSNGVSGGSPGFGRPVSASPPQQRVTPDIQALLDKIGERLNKPAPTNIGRAVDLLRDATLSKWGNSVAGEFDTVYRNWVHDFPDGTGSAESVSQLLRALWVVYAPPMRGVV